MSHFAAIGLDGETPEEMEEVVGRALDLWVPPPLPESHRERHGWFEDASGAALAIHWERPDEVECLTPFFVAPGGGTRWRVRTGAPHLDGECRHCSGADCDVLDRDTGELVTRATVQWLFFEPYRDWLSETREYDLEVVGFASRLFLGATEADLEEGQAMLFGEVDPSQPRGPGNPMRLADKAFLPYGMFEHAGDVSQRACAFVTGTVSAFSTPLNGLSGDRFVHLRVETLAGSLTVVAPGVALDGAPTAPKVALADVWLVGRPMEAPPAAPSAKRGGFLRLLRGG